MDNLVTSSGEPMFLITAANKLCRKLKWGTASSKVQMQRMATRWNAACCSNAINFCRYACKCTWKETSYSEHDDMASHTNKLSRIRQTWRSQQRKSFIIFIYIVTRTLRPSHQGSKACIAWISLEIVRPIFLKNIWDLLRKETNGLVDQIAIDSEKWRCVIYVADPK